MNKSSTFTFVKENAFVNKPKTEKLLLRFDQIFYNKKYESVSQNVIEIDTNKIHNEPLFASLLYKVKKKFQIITGNSDLIFEKLWLVHNTSNNSDKTQLPFIPHIDKQRCLKAMVYLHNVNLSHGPIYLGKIKNSFDMEQKRIKLPKNYRKKNLNFVSKNELQGDMIPMLGKAGDVIFFDTNSPHKAGIVKKNYSRKVLRFKFVRPNSVPKITFLRKLIKKFIND